MSVELERLARRMMKLFKGNEQWHYTADFSAVNIESSGKRIPRYVDVAGAPTLEEFIDHLQGKRGLLVIPVTAAGSCCFGKLDIDEYPTDAPKWARLIKKWGLPLVVERSKSGGVHLAHYSPYNMSAVDMRAKLAEWAALLRCPKKTEIFPKQERLAAGDKGTGLNLPYVGGDSEATRNYAIDEHGERLALVRWLDIIERMPAKPSHTPGQVNIEAAAELLSRHWTDGQRDNLNIAAAGTLLRAGVESSIVQEILDASSDVAADPAQRKTAEQIEAAIDGGNKRIPGFRSLVELIGADDARELMRLTGGKPPPEALPFDFGCVDAEWLNVAPPALTYSIEPILPSGVVGMLVAEGGAGKTTFGLRMAIAVAGGREFFGMPTRRGRVVYVACEEHEAGLRRRLFWIINREREKMRAEKRAPEAIEQFEANVLQNLTLRSAVGYEMYLISARNGEASQSGLVEALIERLPRPLELLILDPISRLNGAEENSNQVGTALVNAAERIARECEATVLLCHHTGKSAAKDRDATLYAARGASGFVDAARSSIRLMAADADAAREFTNVPPDVVARGDLVQVIHNKSNEGPKAQPFWIRRQQLDFELFVPEVALGAAPHAKLLGELFAWWCGTNKRAPFSPTRITKSKELRAEIWPGLLISIGRAHEVITRAQDEGDLIPGNVKAERSTHALWQFRDDFAGDSM